MRFSIGLNLVRALALALPAVMAAGCASGSAADELREYATETLPPLKSIERGLLDKYEEVSGANYSDEAALYEGVRDAVLPLCRELIVQSEAVLPAADEVKRLHDGLLAAARRYFSAFNLLMIAIDRQNPESTAVALRELEEARRLSREFDLRLGRACRENGIELPGISAD